MNILRKYKIPFLGACIGIIVVAATISYCKWDKQRTELGFELKEERDNMLTKGCYMSLTNVDWKSQYEYFKSISKDSITFIFPKDRQENSITRLPFSLSAMIQADPAEDYRRDLHEYITDFLVQHKRLGKMRILIDQASLDTDIGAQSVKARSIIIEFIDGAFISELRKNTDPNFPLSLELKPPAQYE